LTPFTEPDRLTLIGSRKRVKPNSYDGSGWKLAQEWAGDWSTNLAKDQDLSVPDLSETNQRPELRDGLNAAWLCRILSGQDKVRHITGAAYELCNKIIGKWRYAGQGQGYPQSGLQAAQLGYREASQADR
jgi:hypothetical protein